MSRATAPGVTQILDQMRRGEPGAAEQLFPLVYEELRRLARARMAVERPGQTLQPTALVHEAYLRLLGSGETAWQGRAHFFGAASEAMRRILVERARRVRRVKRGGGMQRVEMEDTPAAGPPAEEVLAVHEALDRLQALDAQMAAVVKLRYFGGLTVEEAAQALALSTRTVNRLWTGARAWLRRQITAATAPPAD